MPKVKKKLFVLILSLIQSATVWSQNSNSLLKDATRHFEVSSFVTAIPKFEQVLQNNPQKLSTSERLSALLQLAYSYKAVGKFENSEQTYRKAFDIPATISGDQLKSYLYFAQVLVQNNKFKEAQEWFEKYNNLSASLRDDARQYQPSTVARISNDPFTQNGRYLVEYLDFNTTRPEFSPMYFKNGLVFCSGKGTGSSLVGNKGFLDLYYISDINKVTGVSEEALNAPKQKAVKTG
jgi:tetratricopeptide (TPR) repeat protein